MALPSVLWMLIFTLTLCWKARVNTEGGNDTDLTYYLDALNLDEVIMETSPHHLQLWIPGGHQRTTLSSSAEYGDNILAAGSNLTRSAAATTRAVNIVSRTRIWHEKSLKILELQKSMEVPISSTDEASLGQMLAALVKEELRDCALVVTYDTGYSGHVIMQELLLLHNPRQVVYVNTTEDLTRIIWTSSKCRGYFFLLDNLEPLLDFGRTYQDTWDYSGRFVVVVPSLRHLETFVDSYLGKMTEQIVGVVKSVTEGEWVLHMNQLYWGPGVRRINTWYRHRFTRQLDLFPDKLSDLQGAVLTVSTFHYEPCNFLRRAENGTVVHRYGMDISIVKSVARVMNATLRFIETPNGETWGERHENGSWYGLMGQLHRHEADIAVSYMFVTSYWLQETVFMARMEPPLPLWQALAFPFHQWTWLAVLVGFIVSGPLLFLLARGSGRCGGEIQILQDLSFAWYYAFGLHFCEAHKTLPRNPCTQVFVQFLWLYTMIVTISYSANLKSFLLVRKQPTMMQTFKELYESGLEVGALGYLFRDGFALSTNPYLKGLTEVFKYYDDDENLYPEVLKGKSVYLGNIISVDFLMKTRFARQGRFSVRYMKEFYVTYNVGMGLQRHSPLKRKLDQQMGRIQQSGLVRKFYHDVLRLDASYRKADGGVDDSGGGQEDVAEADGVIPLSLDHMQGLFLITCFGWFAGLFFFTLEKTVSSH